ncbi:MAG: transcriptional repressor LexA [Acidobacteria bacterium]|jgi:repressor LexA|nr:transcriptional repressor LexA [Acidobacteriota bacterium]
MVTRKQKLILDKIREFRRRNGYFPTMRELAAAAGLSSPATVQAYLERMRGRGALVKRGRAWELPESQDRRPPGGRVVPLVGVVPAGPALEMFAELGDEVVLPEWLAEKGGDIVAFRVQGQSMKDAYIQDGDLVLIRRSEKADPGQMVVARLGDGSITLKRLKRDRDAYVLVPENPEYAPITAPFQLVGKVVGVMRKYR